MRNKQKQTTRFWLISGLLHALALVVVFLTPAGQRVFQREERPLRPEIIRKGDELAEVIDDIRDRAVTRLQARVAMLEAGRDRMTSNLDTISRLHEPFAAVQVASAIERLRQAGEKTVQLQEEILRAARRAVQSKEHGSDPMWRVFEKNRAAIVAGQEEIRRALLLTASDDADLLALQNQAEDAQMNAFEALAASVSAQNRLWGFAAGLRTLAEQKAKLEQELAAATTLAGELGGELERQRADELSAAQTNQRAQDALALAKKTVETARREKTGEAAAREALKLADAEARTARQAADKARDLRAQTERKLRGPTGQMEARAKSLAKNADDTANTRDKIAPAESERDTRAASAVELQERALAEQREVLERLLARPQPAPEALEKTTVSEKETHS